MRLLTGPVLGLQALYALATGYLLVLLAAAVAARRVRPRSTVGSEDLYFAVVIPAHDEEAVIAHTLESLRSQQYPRDRFAVVVVADNCRDRTVELAAATGAVVYERHDRARRGKGHALAWALPRLLAERPEVDAVVILDADCRATPNLLTAIQAPLRAGAAAIQVNDAVANPGASWSASLRFASFALFGLVRALGRSTLGLSCGLQGTGMALSRRLLERLPWEAFSVTEDGEYHLRLVAAGERVVFVPEASVESAMPTSLSQARAQHLRWESGKWRLIRVWVPRLAWDGLCHRDLNRLHAALELLVPPQSLLLAGTAASGLLAAGLRSRVGLKLAIATLLGQAGYVVGGLLLARAPLDVYRALLLAPVLVLWKLRLFAEVLVGGGPTSWVRTAREAGAPSERGG